MVACPACGSEQVQKVSAIYTQQTATGSASGGANAVSQSLLAQRLAPPVKARIPWWGYVIMYFGLMGFIVLAFVIYFVWSQAVKKANEGYEERLAAWQRSYYCHQCDTVFDPAAASVPAATI